MKTTYAKAAGSCIALSVLILAAFVLTGCQSLQETIARGDGLTCDAPADLIEHAITDYSKDRVLVTAACDLGPPPAGKRTVGCARGGALNPEIPAAIWYARGDYYTRCHEVTHVVCGYWHNSDGWVDREVLKQCGGVQ